MKPASEIRYKITRLAIVISILVMATIDVAFYTPYAAQPTQQSTKDSGVTFGKGLMSNVQNIGKTSKPSQLVPGYAGSTTLPQTQYYNNQDLNGLQTNAMNSINNGTANDASQFTYQQALQPKLSFSPSDPLLTNANTVSTQANANPTLLTTQTGSCNTANVTSTVTRKETCTAWLQPTQQSCSKTLNVNVTWKDISSCPLGTSFNQVSAVHYDYRDHVYARAYCDPGANPGFVSLELYASGANPSCAGWQQVQVSTNQPTNKYTGALLRPDWHRSCRYVPAFANGSCVNNQCNYTITYHQLTGWSGTYKNGFTCSGTPMDLAALGYTGPGGTLNSGPLSQDPYQGYYCVYRSTSVTLKFEEPHITRQPTVTDTWNDGCGLLQAQVK